MNLELNGYMKDLKIVRTNGVILNCKYSDDRKSWIAGRIDGRINLYSGKSEDPETILEDTDTADINNTVTGFTSKRNAVTNTILASYSGGLVKKWNYKTKQCLFTIREERQTLGITYQPRVDKFFSLGDDGKIMMYDEETQRRQHVFAPSEKKTNDGHSSRIFAICFNPANSNEFITGGWDTTVHFWDVRQPHSVRHIDQIYIGGEGLAINPQGNEFISFAWARENAMQLWNYSTGKLIQTITPDSNITQLYCGKYVNEKFVASGGSDTNLFRVIDISTYSTVTSVVDLAGGVYSLDFKSPLPGKSANIKAEDVTELPHMLFCSAKNLYELRFK